MNKVLWTAPEKINPRVRRAMQRRKTLSRRDCRLAEMSDDDTERAALRAVRRQAMKGRQ